MPKLRFSAESNDDLKEIARYIANDKPNAAREWVTKINEKCHLLASHPDIGEMRPELGDGIRCTYVVSYVVFFRRKDDSVEIARVIPGDRDPQSLARHPTS